MHGFILGLSILPIPYVLITVVCSGAWSQEAWILQLHFSFSRLLWLFGVFCVSTEIVKSFCSHSMKNAIVNLIGIAFNCRLFWIVYSFSQYWFFPSKYMVYISSSVCAIFDFFHQYLRWFCEYRSFTSLETGFLTRYLILFVAVVNEIVSLISLDIFVVNAQKSLAFLYINFVICNFTKFTD